MRRTLLAQEAVKAEEEVNAKEFELAIGVESNFGAIYQLVNPSCGKYIQVQKLVADTEPTALQCRLSALGDRSKQPWFRMLPGAYAPSPCTACARCAFMACAAAGFRTRNEGEAIRMNDTVVLQSMKVGVSYVLTRLQCHGE